MNSVIDSARPFAEDMKTLWNELNKVQAVFDSFRKLFDDGRFKIFSKECDACTHFQNGGM